MTTDLVERGASRGSGQDASAFLIRERDDDIAVATQDIQDPRIREREAAIVAEAFDGARRRVLVALRNAQAH